MTLIYEAEEFGCFKALFSGTKSLNRKIIFVFDRLFIDEAFVLYEKSRSDVEAQSNNHECQSSSHNIP